MSQNQESASPTSPTSPAIEIPEKIVLDDNFYRRIEDYRMVETTNELDRNQLSLSYSFGLESSKQSNLAFLTESILITAAGNALVFINIKNLTQDHIMFESMGTIGAIAVHPSRKYIAVGCKGVDQPPIYIFEYPSLKLYRVINNGAEHEYTCLSFHHDGNSLASVGGNPDYTLTIWNWKQEQIILRAKAFSQEVYNVSFSPNFDGVLTTSGMGHIKFWRMAHTFTGLKLQGYLGKFGVYELSDIYCFQELPDGKILSGSEGGNLYLWEGGFIKCEITAKNRRPCHQGAIRTCILQESEIITSGDDGFVRVWDLESIDSADVSMSSRTFEIEAIDEICVSKDGRIITMTVIPESPAEYLLQDETGFLWKFHGKKRISEKLISFHSGAITGLDTSAFKHELVTLGEDGSIRLYDYVDHIVLQKLKFPVSGTVIKYAPAKLDPTGCTLIAGFSDGTLRLIRTAGSDTLTTLVSLKPHRDPVSFISVSVDGTLFCSASVKNEIFFFSVQESIYPIGFIQLTQDITDLTFSADPTNLLFVTTKEGEVLSFTPPRPDNSDAKTTFEMKIVPKKFSLEWLGLRYKEEIRITSTAANASNSSAPNDPNSTNQPQSASKNENNAPQSPSRTPLSPSKQKELPVLSMAKAPEPISFVPVCCIGVSAEKFLLGINLSVERCEIYECNWKSNNGKLITTLPGSFSTIRFSRSNHYLSIGMEDGSSYLMEYSQNLMNFYHHHLHHQDKGGVSCLFTSFDDSHIFSAGLDGNIFAHRNATVAMRSEISKFLLMAIPLDVDLNALGTYKSPAIITEDIYLDPLMPSIQEAKLKSREDEEKELAEQRKQAVRAFVRDLRHEFLTLIQENEKLPQADRLPMTCFEVDSGLKERSELNRIEKIEAVKNEMAWESEKIALGPQKLMKKFLEPIQTEYLTIEGLRNGHSVSTFRTVKSDIPLSEIPHNLDTAEVQDTLHIDQNDTSFKIDTSLAPKNEEKENDESSQFEQSPNANDASKKSKQDSKSKREARKALRAERATTFQKLLASKPDESYEDPQDVISIKYAMNHIGDYKLKTGEKYIVPESERINADKKRRQMILLQESILTLKEEFNHQVLALRDQKIELLDEIEKKNDILKEINAKLVFNGENVDKYIWSPQLEKTAFPDLRFKITEDDIAQYKSKQQAVGSEKEENIFSFATSGVKQSNQPVTVATDEKVESRQSHSATKKNEVVFDSKENSVQTEERTRRSRELYEEKKLILNAIGLRVRDFDARLDQLRKERISLEGDLVACEMKYLLLYNEWVLLKEFELNDNALSDKLKQRKHEKKEILLKLNECQDKLMTKKTEVEQIIKNGREIYEEFVKSVGENNKYEEFLIKVFKRKIKRTKKKQRRAPSPAKLESDDQSNTNDDIFIINEDREESEQGESESTEDDLDFEEDSFDSDDIEEEFDETCPKDCDSTLYSKILEFREKRMDQEDILNEIQKVIEVMKKDHEALLKKEKVIDSGLASAEKEIEEFQTQKQQKLNELDVIIPLRLSQLQYLENNTVPTNLSSALVFTTDGVERLKERINQLNQEKLDIRHQHKELKKMHINLIKSKKEKQSKLMELEARAYDVQMLKFGRIIDLDKLERMGVNKTTDEIKDKLQKDESLRLKELEDLDDQIYAMREKLISVTKENTMKLESLVGLTESKRTLESSLNSTQKSMTSKYQGLQKQDLMELERLKHTSMKQKEDIDMLKREIHSLVRK